jgi:hypothetical protein
MAISKKGKRKLTVGNDVFYWIYKFQDDFLRLTIMTEEKAHSRIIYNFNCKTHWLYAETRLWDFSPKIIQKAIEYGQKNGWNPTQKGKDFVIKEIDNSFDNIFNSENPETKSAIPNPQSQII